MNMRKMVVCVAALGLLALSGAWNARAALTDSVEVTVRIQQMSVDIGEDTFDFGSLQYNESVVSSVFNVTNTGNVQERYALKASIGPNWSLSDDNGADTAVLYALFRADGEGLPAESLFTLNVDTISATNKEVPDGGGDSDPFCDGAATACDGDNVAEDAFRDMYLMIWTPDSEGSPGDEQTIYLTITALQD